MHSKLATPEPPPSSPLKLNAGEALLFGSAGCAVIVVSGGVLSTVQVYMGGAGSRLPAASIARTLKVWLPSLRL